jgi:hypothetical protein
MVLTWFIARRIIHAPAAPHRRLDMTGPQLSFSIQPGDPGSPVILYVPHAGTAIPP